MKKDDKGLHVKHKALEADNLEKMPRE